ncbi:hypothetical protein TRIUR3_26411 [Triticum urartu]|uniref:Uncharacterized protein n=2 Tax=Triticum TaxID=4564 RepID=A0A9R0S1G4_TRITD|nr:hypothetical protein TRIUR3_26411 [Triticum urartu]VAH69964.1 unnamed protein product [Triticum turgidum subsp. durum]
MQQQRRLSVLLLLLLLGLITTQTQTQQLPGLVTEPRTCVPIVYGAPCVGLLTASSIFNTTRLDTTLRKNNARTSSTVISEKDKQ